MRFSLYPFTLPTNNEGWSPHWVSAISVVYHHFIRNFLFWRNQIETKKKVKKVQVKIGEAQSGVHTFPWTMNVTSLNCLCIACGLVNSSMGYFIFNENHVVFFLITHYSYMMRSLGWASLNNWCINKCQISWNPSQNKNREEKKRQVVIMV